MGEAVPLGVPGNFIDPRSKLGGVGRGLGVFLQPGEEFIHPLQLEGRAKVTGEQPAPREQGADGLFPHLALFQILGEGILIAEGEKKSMVLVAEGHKESAVLNAEGEKEAAILAAEAEKEKKIREAEGQAEAIRSVQKATADGIRFIKEAGADNAVLQLKSLEAFQAAANGKANKIIIPSDIQGIAGLVKSIAEVASKDEAAE